MEFSVGLQKQFIFNRNPIIIFVVVVVSLFAVLGIILLVRKLLEKRQSVDGAAAWRAMSAEDRESLRRKYIMLVDGLAMKVQMGGVPIRTCFHTLSKYVREFISEFTGVKVNKCTLGEIRNMNIPVLANLIGEFYAVEFAKVPQGDNMAAIEKTKWIISKWNS